MSEIGPTGGSDAIDRLIELGQKSSVRIETNAKGLAQVKLCVYAGETEEELQRLSALALKTYTGLQNDLGRLAKFT